jgi:Gas vesicle protein K
MSERDESIAANDASDNPNTPRLVLPQDVALDALARALPDRINADPEHVENGLARLVLTVIELLREILEHQAIRRMDGGTLSDEQIERLGLALLKLSERMDELKATFGLTDEDLNIDLGPLGRLR